MDDPVTGCSIASAWGIIHIASFAKQTFRSLKFLPIIHLAIITTSTGVYLKEFFQDF